jgi:phospholipase/carboxylesterase
LIAGFIDELILNYSIDAKAVSLASAKVLSKLCYCFITSRKISKVIALSGYLNEEIIEENYRNNDFSKLNIFASHGVVDQVIPVTWARKQHPFGRIRNRIYLQRIQLVMEYRHRFC